MNIPVDTKDVNEWDRTDHEVMRVLILSRFEDDVLLRGEVEVWLDDMAAPGEPVSCDCSELELCYCFCKACEGCGTVAKVSVGEEKDEAEGE